MTELASELLRRAQAEDGVQVHRRGPVRNGPPNTDRAWIAGWDASITLKTSNPYKRRDFAEAFQKGMEAGKRSLADDVRILKIRMARSL